MASDTNDYFGFELINRLVDPNLTKKEDVLILFVHWYFVKSGFKCVGLGDSRTFEPTTDRGTDFLPDKWNEGPNYSLRYARDDKLYILVATKSDADLLLNFLRVHDNCTSNVQFAIDRSVAAIHGPLESLLPKHKEILMEIRRDLVEPVYSASPREMSTQTTARADNENHSRATPDDDPLRVQPPLRQPWIPAANPRNIGQADLDPFSRGGGGMIFDPFSSPRGIPGPFDPQGPRGLGVPGRLPPGAVPPGARFDPFGPPEIGGGPRRGARDPDADHFPPPGYDDMFM